MAPSSNMLVSRRPNRHDAVKDQRELHAGAVANFKRKLQAKRNVQNGHSGWFPDGAETFSAAYFLGEVFRGKTSASYEPGMPLCWFAGLPATQFNSEQIASFLSHFTDKVQPHLALWEALPIANAATARQDVYLAAAALGALSMHCPTEWLRDLALRFSFTDLKLDNRLARSQHTAVALLLIETMATLSDSPSAGQQAALAHGFLFEAAKMTLASSVDHRNNRELGGGASTSAALCTALLISDAMRSLHFHITPTAFTGLRSAPLATTPPMSAANILDVVVCGRADSLWPVAHGQNSLVVLVVLLNQTMVWARELAALSRTSAWEPSMGSMAMPANRTLLQQDSQTMSLRLTRALEKWSGLYAERSNAETRALYHFCCLLLHYPALERLAETLSTHHTALTDLRSALELHSLPSKRWFDADVQQALHHAWSVVDVTADCVGLCAVWIPITVFYSALLVWQSVRGQDTLRSHGSVRVMDIFKNTLAKLTWPAAAQMVKRLEELTSSAI